MERPDFKEQVSRSMASLPPYSDIDEGYIAALLVYIDNLEEYIDYIEDDMRSAGR